MPDANVAAANDDEDALDVRVREMTGDELSPRVPAPKSALPKPPPGTAAKTYDDDASIGKLEEDDLPTSSRASDAPTRKSGASKPSTGEIWDDMSNIG